MVGLGLVLVTLSNHAMPHAEERRREEGIARMGTYMLQGWVLLDQVCPNAGCNLPTFRSKDRSRYVCCMCDDPTNPWKPAVDPSPKASLAQGAETFVPQDPTFIDDDFATLEQPPQLSDKVDESSRLAETSRASKLMGQKLLQGWAMLADTCGDCTGIPLMKKAGILLCVGCGKESDGGTLDQNVDGSGGGGINLLGKSGKASSTAGAQQFGRKRPAADQEQDIRDTETRADIFKSDPPTTKATAKPSLRLQPSSRVVSTAESVLDALLQQIEDLRTSLVAERDVRRVAEICDGVRACAQAIASCKLLLDS